VGVFIVRLKPLLATSILLAVAALSVRIVFGETATPWSLLLALVWVALYWAIAVAFVWATCRHSGRMCGQQNELRAKGADAVI
jgi:hypothetical protein